MSVYGADIEANLLFSTLTTGLKYNLPTVDLSGPQYNFPVDKAGALYAPVVRLTNADLTTGQVGGSGTFDALCAGVSAQLRNEFEKGRITGAEYTKAYIALIEAAMGNATQFLLGRDQAFWQAQQAQINAITAQVQLELTKYQLATAATELELSKANYALTKLKLASEEMAYGTAQYQLDNLLPLQKSLLTEQINAQRAQTSDTRSDGTVVSGTSGAQKSLYLQQITSYKRDAENKTVKLWTDAFITMKTVDEGLPVPDQFAQLNLNSILTSYRTNAGL